MKSQKELSMDKIILKNLHGKPRATALALIEDPEVRILQEQANAVSIKRLKYNDHGPVHMRKVVLNALTMAQLLHEAEIKLSLEEEETGNYEDSLVALIIAAFLHDVGMTIGRANHELTGAFIAIPVIERILKLTYEHDLAKRVIIRSLIIECVVGHMASQQIHSKEAGILLIADGCDMEKGRARIPLMMTTESKVGDIHKYSASAVEKVTIEKGERKPIRIEVLMKDSVGFFQIEEVLFKKINSSTIKKYIELHAGVIGGTLKTYL